MTQDFQGGDRNLFALFTHLLEVGGLGHFGAYPPAHQQQDNTGQKRQTPAPGQHVFFGQAGDGSHSAEVAGQVALVERAAEARAIVFGSLTQRSRGSRDTIRLFSRADGDKVDLSAIDADTNTAGNQAFAFVGRNAFSGTAGELRFFIDGAGNKVASGDVDGDRVADFQIAFVAPQGPVGGADFVF